MNIKYLKDSFSRLDPNWQNILTDKCSDDLVKIDNKLCQLSAASTTVYPPPPLIFNALSHTPLSKLKVVILGQDPYHGNGEANGLAFSVNKGIKLPPSLRNIYKELESEYLNAPDREFTLGLDIKTLDGTRLVDWADQGVFLLNSCLTVIKDQANSLAKIGWHEVTDKLIHHISCNKSNVVFMLWGGFAIAKTHLIDESKHLILRAPHPSPLSAYRGFFGCDHFKLANEYLVKNGTTPINWLE
jgi:uracil-DNA glycosylase